ncbi:cytochrome P450 CYP82D47-like [Vigna umbellata]|uniref:cytochrome P450 CYP82D47-like n=1 Tax=Vigna umbellata TaxID=87088 RepID=UPI001F5FB2EA|nr:cytochrome P450 CYP82D47-like [Vigna umbellata]
MAFHENPLTQYTVPLTISFFCLFLFLFVFSSLSRKPKNHSAATRKAPPEASGTWPLIGHLHLLGGSKPPHVTLGHMADKYGPIFTLRLGAHKTLVVSDWKMAKECFTVNDRAFASRPKSMAFELLGYNFSMVGFSPYGSYWRHVRKIATLELLSSHRIDTLKHVMDAEVKAAMKDSYNLWLKKKDGGSEMKRWFGDITLNIMFRTVVGKRFASDGGVNEENERLRKALREWFDLSGSFEVSDSLPYLRWLDLDCIEKKMKRTAKELDGFVQNWLEEHKRNRGCDLGEWKHNQDLMHVLLGLAEQGEEFDGHDPDTTIKATCLALILAGSDTTTGTLVWGLSLLLNNPEILKKAIHELDTEVGRERMVEISDLKKLKYLDAIIKETLRLYPPAPLSLPHESMENCTVGGYDVASGTRLLTNLSKLQRDPSLYPNPLEFCPERFLTTHKEVDVKGQHFELIPFGAGRRMCPGISFSLQATQLTLATLLHGFDIVTIDGGPVDMAEQIGFTSIRASPLQVILSPRLTSHIYDQI